MPRYAAFLRAVSPTNATMPGLKAAFEDAGFGDVSTVLTSGNVVFTARGAAAATLERRAEAALAARLGRAFPAVIREAEALERLLADDPWAAHRLARGAKRVVTFLKSPPAAPPDLPIERDGARILSLRGGEVFTAYVPGPRGGAFMQVIEQAFGKGVTTRTWETVERVARAARDRAPGTAGRSRPR